MENRNLLISIEGNIGSGKSTLLKLIKNQVKGAKVYFEPVVNWQAIKQNPKLNLLEAFYKDPTRWAYTFQQYAHYSRLKSWIKIDVEGLTFTERSMLSDREVFATNSF